MRTAVLVVALAAACRPPASERPPEPASTLPREYPGTLRPPDAMGPDVQWRQRVTAQWGDRGKESFEAVLSKADAELLLVGLSPMGQPGFVLRYAGKDIEFENRSPRELPFPPRYIVLDVQRTFFPWIPGTPPRDGERSERVEGELVHERWAGGRLQHRRFEREDGRPAGAIEISYHGWEDGADAPRRAVLDNGWFGYRLTIETVDQQRLPE
jgi:hypothetical protein